MSGILDDIKNPVPEVEEIFSDREEVYQESKISNLIKKLFGAKSSSEPIENYLNHPLNWDNKKSTSKIIRGLEAWIGELNLAVLDIAFGVMEKMKEGKNQDGA